MNKLKKIISIVTISTFLFTAAAPGAIGATVEELQVQIAELLALIVSLQSDLSALQGTGTTITGCTITSFDRALKLAMTGDDVKCLQIILNSATDTQLTATGVGSPGSETSYFGSLTKAAVIKFQEKYTSEILASYGLTLGTGYVGTTTRAKLNTLLVVVVPTECTVDADCPAGYTCTAATCVQIPTAAGLTVALSALTPATGVIITSGDASPYTGQALVPFTTVNFSAGSEGSVTVTTLKFKRIGISADANFDNTYLYEGDAKLLEGGTISSTYVTFNDAAGIFTVPAGQTKSITLKANLNYDVSAGKTMSFNLVAATDITSDASAVNGTFPISGKVMSVANATDFGYVGLTAGATPGSDDVTVNPQDDYEVWRVTVLANNQDIEIEKLVFTEVGSIISNDLQSFKLYYGGTLLGTAEMDSNYQVVFDLSASPFSMTKGTSRILKLYADIVKGSTRTFKFTLQYPTDFIAKDANYGVYVPAYVSGTWSVIQPAGNYKIAAGSMSVTKAIDSPSGNVALDSTNVSLAKYDFKAVGEDVKVSTLAVTADTTTGVGLDNGKVYLNGVQVGSTKDLTEYNTATSFTFGTSFVVTAGTTGVVEIKADIKTTAANSLTAGEDITIYIDTGVDNAQGKSSLTVLPIPSSPKAGNALTVQAGSLTFTKVAGYGDQTTVAPATGFKIGSFSMLAGSSEGVNVDSITVAISDSGEDEIESLLLKIGADQIGSLKVTPSDSNLFSVNVSLAASESKVVDIYADILSAATISIDATGITVDGTGTSADTSTAANVGDAVALQIIYISASKLSVDIASDNPDDALIVGLTEGAVMTKYKFSSTYEAFNVSEVKVYASSVIDRTAPRTDKSNLPDFLNVWLSYVDIDSVTQTTTKRATFVNGMMHFTGLSLYVPANGTADLTVYADLNAVAATGYARTGDRPQLSLAYYKANSGSTSSYERQTGLLHYGPGTSGTTVMTWVATTDATKEEADGTGVNALRFTVAGGGSDGAELDIPLRDLNLNVMDIDTITFSASSTIANNVPMFTLFVDCDLDGTFDGEIIYQVALGTNAANTWTLMTIASTTAKIHESWGSSCGAALSSGDALSDYNDADAKLVGASFSIWTGSNAIGTYDVDNLVIIVDGTTYNTNAVEDDMGELGTNYVLYKTKPTVTQEGVSSGSLITGNNTLYSFKVAADTKEDVALKRIAFSITAIDAATADLDLDTLKFYKGDEDWTDKVTILDADGNDYEAAGVDLADGAATTTYVLFTDEEIVSKGSSQIYSLRGRVTTAASGDSIQTYIIAETASDDIVLGAAYSTGLGNFIWSDGSYGAAHSLLSLDWTNGYLIKTLGDGLTYTLSKL